MMLGPYAFMIGCTGNSDDVCSVIELCGEVPKIG